MKKATLVLGIIFSGIAFPFQVIAQEQIVTETNTSKGFQVSIEALPQYTWLMNRDDMGNSSFQYLSTFRYAGGVNGQYYFNSSWGLGLDLLYSMQGQRYQFMGTELNKDLTYLKIPLTLNFNYDITNHIVFLAKAGPQLGLLTSAMVKDANGNTLISDQSKAYYGTDLGFVVAFGAGFKLSKKLYLDLLFRYDYSLGTVENPANNQFIDYPAAWLKNPESLSPIKRAPTYNNTVGVLVALRYQLQ